MTGATEGRAAPAPAQGESKNLLLRVVAALVLAPAAIAIAYAGGWFWPGLATLAAIGMFVEWLMIVRASHETRVGAAGIVALGFAGICLASGRIDAALFALPLGALGVALLSPRLRGWNGLGFCYAFAVLFASVLVRVDQTLGFRRADVRSADRLGDGHRRLFRRSRHRRTETLVTNQPEKNLGRRNRRLCRGPPGRRRIHSFGFRQTGPFARSCCGAFNRLAARRSLRISGKATLRRKRLQARSFPGMVGSWIVSTDSLPRWSWPQ